jgi:CcmD family protein
MTILGKKWAAAAVAAIALAFGPAAAFAQEFQKVEGLPRQELPAGPFVVAAYGFIWVAVLAYVFVIARGLARVDRELGDIARKLGAKEPPR